MNIRSVLITLSSLATLSACASVMDGQQQKITLNTPGETNVICYLNNGTLAYVVKTGETKIITKAARDIQAHCKAPGNREKTFTVPWILEPWTAGNVVNGIVPGVTYDVLAKSVFSYPDIVTVDFSDQKVTSIPVPDYMNYPIGGIEGYAPGVPATEADQYRVNPVVRKLDPSELGAGSNPFQKSYGYAGGNDGGPIPLTPLPLSRYSSGSSYDPSSEEK